MFTRGPESLRKEVGEMDMRDMGKTKGTVGLRRPVLPDVQTETDNGSRP